MATCLIKLHGTARGHPYKLVLMQFSRFNLRARVLIRFAINAVFQVSAGARLRDGERPAAGRTSSTQHSEGLKTEGLAASSSEKRAGWGRQCGGGRAERLSRSLV